jgi:aspartokinase
MITNYLEVLTSQASNATQELAMARTQISTYIEEDYRVGSSSIERLISAQYSAKYWGQVLKIINNNQGNEQQVQGLREWAERRVDELLSSGRSRSTSLIANAMSESEEDEMKRVLQRVRNLIEYVDDCS